MNEWTNAAKKRKTEIDAANEKANDFQILLNALPPGQRKQMLKDEACAAILTKYGITE